MKSHLFLLLIFVAGCSHSENASIKVTQNSESDVKVVSLNESIGIETLGGVFTPLLQSGCALPCSFSQTFSTAEDNQDQITIHLFQGNASTARGNKSLGSYRISGIAPMPRAEANIKVDFVADKYGFTLTASDLLGTSNLKLTKINP